MKTRREAEKIARKRVQCWTAAAAGVSWVPGSTFALGALDIGLVTDVARIFAVDDSNIEAFLSSVGASLAAKQGANVALEVFSIATLGLGTIVKGAVATGTTVALGETMIRYFREKSPLPWARVGVNRVTHNVIGECGKKGMEIDLGVSIGGLKGKKAKCIVYFHYSGGANLKDKDGQFCLSNGQVGIVQELTPRFEVSTWESRMLFMPNSQLHAPKGRKSKLKFDAYLFRYEGGSRKFLAASEWRHFTIDRR